MRSLIYDVSGNMRPTGGHCETAKSLAPYRFLHSLFLALLLLVCIQPFASAVPTITTIEPVAGPVGTRVYVHGSGFLGASSVKFNQTAASFEVNSTGTAIAATVPAGATTGSIFVTNGDGTGQSSQTFTVTSLDTAPGISSFSPASGAVGSEVVINGLRLGGATAVKFGTLHAASFTVSLEGTKIVARVPAGAVTAKISVTTSGGTAVSATNFTVTLPPEIASFTPASGPVGTRVTISGFRFGGTTAVQFGSVKTTSFTLSGEGTTISATVPVGAVTGKIYVLTNHGNAASATSFTVTSGDTAPVISSFSPASGPVGTEVVINGQRLGGASAVKFGDLLVSSFTVNAEGTRIVTRVPTGAVTSTIRVATPAGIAASATQFVVAAPAAPKISSFSPPSGPAGTLVKVTGSNFINVSAVTLNGAAAAFAVSNAGTLTAKVPVGASTGLIRVTTPGGTAVSATSFVVTDTKNIAIFGFAPAAGAPGSVVKILGRGFAGATAVKIGGVACTSFTLEGDRRIHAIVPAGALSGGIVVIAPAGVAEHGTNRYTVAPRITGLSRSSGAAGSLVNIVGANMVGVTAVTFNGIGAAFTVTAINQITAEVPPGAGTGVVSIVNAGGTANSAATFTVTQ